MTLLRTFLLCFGTAAVTALLVTPLVRLLAPRLGAVARPTQDRWNRRTVPLLGGVAVWVATSTAALLFLNPGDRTFQALYGVSSLFFAVGVADDFLNMKPGAKLTAQLACACVALVLLPGRHLIPWPALDLVVTLLWVVAITNAFNLLDNMDGVCAGVAVVAAISYVFAVGTDGGVAMAYAAALAGAAAGFLVFNFQPASIFLGDGGSLFIGGSFALISLTGGRAAQQPLLSTVLVPILVLLLPIFDTTLVTLMRKLAARSASVGGRDHTSHRLVALGFSERQTALILYALAAAGGAAAGLLRYSRAEGMAVASLVALAALLLGVGLSRVRVYGDQDFALLRERVYTPLLVDITYKRRIFEVLLDVGLIGIAYYAAYVLRFDDDLPRYRSVFERSLPIVIACQLISSGVAGVYRGVWRYVSVSDVAAFVEAVLLGTVTSVLAVLYLYRFEDYSRGVFIIYAIIFGILLAGSRLFFRVLGETASRARPSTRKALIYGAGDAGALVARELMNNPEYDMRPVGFIDDDPSRKHRRIVGVRVLGTAEDVPDLLEELRPQALVISTRKLDPGRCDFVCDAARRAGVEILQLDLRLRPRDAPVGTVVNAE